MTHDQLARVFPDGRTVHVPSDGTPLKGYELARAEIERRGEDDGPATVSKPSLLSRLFGGKSNDEDEEGSAPVQDKTAPAIQVAAAKPADAVPMPRGKPGSTTLQLASADTQIVQPAKSKQMAASDKSEAKPETPADIINARGFWDDMPAAPKQATPAQVAALNARQTVTSTDPQSTSSVPAAYRALAYAPAESPVDHASAPAARNTRTASASNRNPAVVNDPAPFPAKGQGGVVAASTRVVASKADDTWMRIMMLAPSASTSMSVTVLGDPNMTLLSAQFVKPQAVVVMGFSDDPQAGLAADRFSGSATATLATQSFVLRTASLH